MRRPSQTDTGARSTGQFAARSPHGTLVVRLISGGLAFDLVQAAPPSAAALPDAPSEIGWLVTIYNYAGAERLAQELLLQTAAQSGERSLATAAALDTLVSVLVLKNDEAL